MQSNRNESSVKKEPVVLWIASWYPSVIDRFTGDFIQRSAKAFALYHPLHVFYIAKDDSGLITNNQRIETHKIGALTETILYYHPPKTGITLLDKIISTFQYNQLGRSWLKAFKKKHPDREIYLEVGVAMRAGTLALWMKRKWGHSFVVQEHWTGYYRELMPPALQKPKWFWKINKEILDQANAVFPDSRHLGETIQKTLSKVPYEEIPNTVDTQLFYPKKKGKTSGTFRFIHVSTLGYQKNTDGIIRVLIRLSVQAPELNVECMMVGPDPEVLQQQFAGISLERYGIQFTGSKSYQEVAALMQSADAMVLFSRYENLPCVMLEALCCGLPVIATRVGGIAWHLDAKSGILVDSENEDQLLEALQKMVNDFDQYDQDYIARKAASRYAMPVIGERYMEAYQKYFPGFEAPLNS